mgnify:CR=1 FL=1
MLASASKAIIVGFNVRVDTAVQKLAEREGVLIRKYDIIYRLVEDIEKALKGMLEPEEQEIIVGHAKVLTLFISSKIGTIAGCRVTQGKIQRNGKMRVFRNDKIVFDGEVASLRREKDKVREVREGFECGVRIKGFNDIKVGDILECYITEEVASQE